jgi:hypothetical protein
MAEFHESMQIWYERNAAYLGSLNRESLLTTQTLYSYERSAVHVCWTEDKRVFASLPHHANKIGKIWKDQQAWGFLPKWEDQA